jgi:hypothetical protein
VFLTVLTVFLTVFLRVLMMGLLAVSWCTLVCTMSIMVQLVLRMFRGVVSVVVLGVNLLSLGSLDEHSTAIFLDLLAMVNSTAILLDSAGLFLMVMMRRFLSVVVVSFLLLYVALFSFSSHNVHLHGGLVLDDLGGGDGGASSVVLSTASSSDFSPDYTWSTLFLITFTAIFLDTARVFLVAARAVAAASSSSWLARALAAASSSSLLAKAAASSSSWAARALAAASSSSSLAKVAAAGSSSTLSPTQAYFTSLLRVHN